MEAALRRQPAALSFAYSRCVGHTPRDYLLGDYPMASLKDIDAVLARMVELLRMGGSVNWAAALERHRASLAGDMVATAARIRAMYGGMGSLNDVVLSKDGRMLGEENDELDTLRSKLYELAQ
jgi:hypothetical protein